MATDVTIIVGYLGYGLVATAAGNAVAFAAAAVPYLAVACWLVSSPTWTERPPGK